MNFVQRFSRKTDGGNQKAERTDSRIETDPRERVESPLRRYIIHSCISHMNLETLWVFLCRSNCPGGVPLNWAVHWWIQSGYAWPRWRWSEKSDRTAQHLADAIRRLQRQTHHFLLGDLVGCRSRWKQISSLWRNPYSGRRPQGARDWFSGWWGRGARPALINQTSAHQGRAFTRPAFFDVYSSGFCWGTP